MMSDSNDMDVFINALNDLPDDIMSAKFDGHKPEKKKKVGNIAQSSFDKTIDLHGLTKHDALILLRNTLTLARGKRLRILVITGKGNHSEDNYGVVREAVKNFFDKAGSIYIREYGFASRQNGGDGAFEILTK